MAAAATVTREAYAEVTRHPGKFEGEAAYVPYFWDEYIRCFADDDSMFEHEGFEFKVRLPYDEDALPPWESADSHGPVSKWERRDKRPGERILCSDRNSHRFYDAHEAAKIAKRDGWRLGEKEIDGLRKKLGREPKPGDIRAEAVERDFEYLRRWCNDGWCYVGVVVELQHPDFPKEEASVWGIESDAHNYLESTAHELADEILVRVLHEANEVREWAERDVVTQ